MVWEHVSVGNDVFIGPGVVLTNDLHRSKRGDVRRHDARTGDDDRLGRTLLRVLTVDRRSRVSRVFRLRRSLVGRGRAQLGLRLRVGRRRGVVWRGLRKGRTRESDTGKQRRNHKGLISHFFPLRRVVTTRAAPNALRSPRLTLVVAVWPNESGETIERDGPMRIRFSCVAFQAHIEIGPAGGTLGPVNPGRNEAY